VYGRSTARLFGWTKSAADVLNKAIKGKGT